MAARPEVGDILLVIHDFQARSSDELSLAKGDRVELLERDDEFGDGWFLGRHMANDNTGLFPEVYTRLAPKGVAAIPSIASNPAANPPSSTNGTSSEAGPTASSVLAVDRSSAPQAAGSMLSAEPSPIALPLNSVKLESRPSSGAAASSVGKSNSIDSVLGGSRSLHSSSGDNSVLHETLTVIDEHITDLHSAPNSSALNATTDSSSEYSSHIHDRLSYIQGEETDEEEEVPHSRADVESWDCDQVAEYLFTVGVERKHCEVFRDQEISGEVLLGMDQSSLFLKAFDLGSVGRRLKTWQKIKGLQDEVNGLGVATRRNTQTFSDAGSEDSRAGRMRSRTNTLTNSSQRYVHGADRPPSSAHSRRLSQTPKLDSMTPIGTVSPRHLHDSPTRASHQKRPSAASVRDLHHSRRHSSTDYRLGGSTPVNAGTPKIMSSGTFPLSGDVGSHRKQPSFDRNWTMGTATPAAPRPVSSTDYEAVMNASNPDLLQQPSADLDRGYFSGTEVDGRKQRNVLKKRDSMTSHSRSSSYAEQQRMRSATATARHSRYGSMDSPDLAVTAAAQKFHGLASEHRRTASAKTNESIRQRATTSDGPSPTVTKLEGDGSSPRSASNRQAIHADWFSKPAAHIAGSFSGLRAISDAVTRNERTKLGSPTESSLKESPRSSTPSGGPSFELDSPSTAKSPLSATTTSSRKSGKKTKKDTSAYQRGLLKIGPREAVKDSDYSGWMKKKSSHLMTTWKPRFFVLKGRRLAYYYSEDDTEEKGLIDISFHRVLSADTEKLQGLHATLTGASNTPIMPADSNLAQHTDNEMAAIEKGTDTMFIFKLVPPRAGLTKAVNFTKPMVHYFAVPNLQLGRAWMAALVKATIDRDDTQPMTSTYQQKTISLAKARAMRHRPPALMNLDEKAEENGGNDGDDEKKDGLGISFGEVDSAVSGLGKMSLHKVDSASKKSVIDNEKGTTLSVSQVSSPQSA